MPPPITKSTEQSDIEASLAELTMQDVSESIPQTTPSMVQNTETPPPLMPMQLSTSLGESSETAFRKGLEKYMENLEKVLGYKSSFAAPKNLSTDPAIPSRMVKYVKTPPPAPPPDEPSTSLASSMDDQSMLNFQVEKLKTYRQKRQKLDAQYENTSLIQDVPESKPSTSSMALLTETPPPLQPMDPSTSKALTLDIQSMMSLHNSAEKLKVYKEKLDTLLQYEKSAGINSKIAESSIVESKKKIDDVMEFIEIAMETSTQHEEDLAEQSLNKECIRQMYLQDMEERLIWKNMEYGMNYEDAQKAARDWVEKNENQYSSESESESSS